MGGGKGVSSKKKLLGLEDRVKYRLQLGGLPLLLSTRSYDAKIKIPLTVAYKSSSLVNVHIWTIHTVD